MGGVSPWQLCYDENTGYNYYWNVETNEVKWEISGSDGLQIGCYNDQISNQSFHTPVASSQPSENPPACSTSVTMDNQVNNHNGITLITSYGSNSDEDNGSDIDENLNECIVNSLTGTKGDSNSNPVVYGPFLPQSESTSANDHAETKAVVYGPELPSEFGGSSSTSKSPEPNDEPITNTKFSSLVPYGDDDENVDNQRDTTANNDNNNVRKADGSGSSIDGSNSASDDDSDDGNDDENALLSRLREKAIYLKRLGGVVPDELKSIVDETKTVEDIIAEIENELPPDHVGNHLSNTDNTTTAAAATTATIMIQKERKQIDDGCEKSSVASAIDGNSTVSSAISLIADYGNESEPENEKYDDEKKSSEKTIDVNQQQTVVNNNESYTAKDISSSKLSKKIKSTNLKVIKLSSRARELIKTSMLTAKARQTNFVQTKDGLKPAEQVAADEEEKAKLKLDTGSINDVKKIVSKNKKKMDKLETTSDGAKITTIAAAAATIAAAANNNYNNDKENNTTSKETNEILNFIGAKLPASSGRKPLFAAFAEDAQKSTNRSSIDYWSLWAMDKNQVFSISSNNHNNNNNNNSTPLIERKGLGFSDDSVGGNVVESSVDSVTRNKYNIRFVKSETININDAIERNSTLPLENADDNNVSGVVINKSETTAKVKDHRHCTEPPRPNTAVEDSKMLTNGFATTSKKEWEDEYSSDSDMVIDDDNLSDIEQGQRNEENKCESTDNTRDKEQLSSTDDVDKETDIDITDIILNGNVSASDFKNNGDMKVVELSQLIMEKLRYLNTGGGIISPVQIMAIQIETLMGAWHAKALDLKYLEEWLEASSQQLKSIEDTVVPEGWHCEWDRSFRRYYYRNVNTGAVQWNFPNNINMAGKQEFTHEETGHVLQPWMEQESIDVANDISMDFTMPVAPPAPKISSTDELVPPPAPIISDLKRCLNDQGNNSPKKLRTESSVISESPSPSLPPVESLPETPPAPTISRISSSSSVVSDTIPPPLPPIPPPPVVPPPPPPSSPPPSPAASPYSVNSFSSASSSPSLSAPPPPLPFDPPLPLHNRAPPPPPPPPPETPPPPPPLPVPTLIQNIVPPLPPIPPTPIVQTAPPPPPPPPPLPHTATQTLAPPLPHVTPQTLSSLSHTVVPQTMPPEVIGQNSPMMFVQHPAAMIIQNPPLPPSSVVIQNIPSQQQSSQTSPNIHRSSSHIHHRQSAQSSHVKSISSNCIISSASVLYDNKSNCNQDKDNPSLAFSSSSTGKENTQEDNDEPDKSAVRSNSTEEKTSHKQSNLISALDSFYSDIASLGDDQIADQMQVDSSVTSPNVENQSHPEETKSSDSTESLMKSSLKKKKKMKFDVGLSLKKKGLEGLVAKWQKVNSSLN